MTSKLKKYVSHTVGCCVLFGVMVAALPGCRIVAPHQREYLADPTMAPVPNAMVQRSRRKVHTAREGAAGGDGKPAGGGCGCSN